MAYYSLEPWGERRADLRSGIVASTIANVNRPKGGKAYKPQDFMPRLNRREKKQTIGQMRSIVMAAAEAARHASSKRQSET